MIAESLLNAVEKNAASQGVVFSYRERHLSGLSLTLRDVRIDGIVRRVPLSLRIEELQLSPKLLALLSGTAFLSVSAQLYRGSMNADLASSFDGSAIQIEAHAERLELSDHPMVRALGIERGQFSFTAPKIEVIKGIPSGTFSLELVRFGKSTNTDVALPNLGTVTIPAFERLSARLKGGIQNGKLIVRPFDVESDFGKVGGNLSLERQSVPAASRQPSDTELNGRFDVTLTPSGSALIGQWLPVMSNGSLSAEHTRFEILVTGSSAKPQVRMTG
jgi:hypothetical protein